MKIVVAGATGFVASHLVPRLLGEGHSVIALGLDRARLERFAGAEVVVADMREDFASALPKRCDAVVQLAQANVSFPGGERELFSVNVASTQRLLEYSRGAGVAKFVLASTGSVYGGGERPWSEGDCAGGGGFYAATKLAAESLVMGYAGIFSTAVLRLFAPYGPGSSGRLIDGLLERVSTGMPVTLHEGGRPRLNPIYVADVTEVFAQTLAVSADTVVNVAGEEIVSIADIAELIGAVVGRAPIFAESVSAEPPGDAVGAIDLMRASYALPPLTSLEDGIRAMLAHQP
ncbi:MAG TPA: NAD(P)-dependent oxidoreductase [Gaiellaceae bacterium]